MTLSIWRYAHLALAIISSLFLLILAVTGVILAVDAIYEKTPPYRVTETENITLAQVVPTLREVYPEIIEISVDHNQFVSIDAMDEEGNMVQGYINPTTGEVLGELQTKSDFIQWTTALHRSLFLKTPGRIIIGAVSFLLMLITISGLVLIIKRQQGLRHFFDKINKDFFAQYFHVVSGRLLLIPIFIIALTGTYLFMIRLDLIPKPTENVEHPLAEEGEGEIIPVEEFPIFKETKLVNIEKLEFPFMPDDPDEFFVLKLRDRTVTINQISGAPVEETYFAYTEVLEKLNLDLHTGRTNILWAIILGIASLNIVFFIYTGFVITFKRTRTKVKNKYKAEEAQIILLVGSENGSTLFFANQILKQLLADGKTAHLTEMNQYRIFPQAERLLVFTSTFGQGTAPTNALQFEKLVAQFPQSQPVHFSVVGFGSKSYTDFCGYAETVDKLLAQQSWANRYLDLYTVNDKSTDEFVQWATAWTEKSLIPLATAPTLYSEKVAGLQKLKVVEKTVVTDENSTFKVLLKPISKVKFQSGDLLTVYPANDNRERFYSIGGNDGCIQLMVKLHPQGLGSGYLHDLTENQIIEGRVLANPNFHLPKQVPSVMMIANGTGIAPFLGMVMENNQQLPLYLYVGFRYNNSLAKQYQEFATAHINKKQLHSCQFAFSREQTSQYVMDLIRRDADFFTEQLEKGGVIMICGSLNMQHDVEAVLDNMTQQRYNKPLRHYKEQNQILTDCY